MVAVVRSSRADSAASLREVTKADEPLPDGPCIGLLVGTPGTLNYTDMSGTALTDVPIQEGWNPIQCLEVNTGGTADNIWAAY